MSSCSCLFAVQVRTQLDLLRYWKETATYKNEVYFLPNQLDEKGDYTSLFFMTLERGMPWSISSWTR